MPDPVIHGITFEKHSAARRIAEKDPNYLEALAAIERAEELADKLHADAYLTHLSKELS